MKSRWLMVLTAAVLVLTSCSGEDLAESVIEQQIESESGEDVDIDIDDGEISIQTEDGEVIMQSDGDQTVIQSDDGTMVIGATGGELPEGFPSDVPLPQEIQLEQSTVLTEEDGQTFVITGTVDAGPGDVLAAYAVALESAGFTQLSMTTTPDGGFLAYDNGVWSVGGNVGPASDGGSGVGVTVVPSNG